MNRMEYFSYFLIASGLIYIFRILLIPDHFQLFPKSQCENRFDNQEDQSYRQLLLTNFVVYKLLSEKERKLFEKRVCKFIKMKNFKAGKSIAVITDEMRIMIAASAVQITYGYPGVYFNHFKTIILFAEEYYSRITGYYHEGEVNSGGAIVLSWRNFLSGFSDMTDGKNLALHEMAHALRLTNIIDNEEYDFFDRNIMQEFEYLARVEMKNIERGDNTFFRSYASANKEEFFSVAVECFFEKPADFRAYNPRLYELMAMILKIDLLNFRKS